MPRQTTRFVCDKFFDDWFLYAVPSEIDRVVARRGQKYHARYLTGLAKIKIPFFKKSIYDSAIRADMTIGDVERIRPASYYRENSKIVQRHYQLHKNYDGVKK